VVSNLPRLTLGVSELAKDSSPFHQTNFHPIGDIYTTKGILFGLKKSDGEILINFDQSTLYSELVKIARITKCEIVQVHGTWTFLPHKNVVINEEDSVSDNAGGD
jgi:hypothetical protein